MLLCFCVRNNLFQLAFFQIHSKRIKLVSNLCKTHQSSGTSLICPETKVPLISKHFCLFGLGFDKIGSCGRKDVKGRFSLYTYGVHQHEQFNSVIQLFFSSVLE